MRKVMLAAVALILAVVVATAFVAEAQRHGSLEAKSGDHAAAERSYADGLQDRQQSIRGDSPISASAEPG
jgi:hypothetical protein